MYKIIKVISLSFVTLMMAHAVQASEAHHGVQAADNGVKKEANVSSGVIKNINPEQHKITLSHGAVPAINWPAMTMSFKFTPETDSVKNLKVGDEVNFSFYQQGYDYVLQDISLK